MRDGTGWVDLYWLPLGAGGHVVRRSGRVYERLVARREHRSPQDLYHCALTLHVDGTTYAVEMGPVWSVTAADRGVVAEGPVGARWLGRLRAFTYEVRCWPGGSIPDLAEAVDSPVRVSADAAQASRVLHVLREVPPLTWGRDELRTGEMWNSHALVSWHSRRPATTCPPSTHLPVGKGSVSAAAARFGREHGITVIDGGCPGMFGATADGGHKVMRAALSLTGNVPRHVG